MEAPHFSVLCATSQQWLSLAQIPRLLRRAGAYVTFLGPAGAWPLRGSFVDRWIPAEGSPDQIAAALGEHLARADSYDWIIIGDDPLLAALGVLREHAWARAALPLIPDEARVGLLGSKLGFVRSAEALGLPIPPSRICQGAEQIRGAMRAFDGPVLLKEEGPSGGDGCRLLQDLDALAKAAGALPSAPVVVQAYLSGPVISIEALYDRGRLRYVVTSTVVKAWPPPFGVSAIRRFAHDHEAAELAGQIGLKTGLHGFANLTMLRDPGNGELRLIELDPRPNALFHLGDPLGLDITGTLRAMLEGADPVLPRHLPPGLDIHVPVYPADVLRCVIQRDWRGLFSWATNADGRWRWLPPGDPRMAAAYRTFIVRQLARRARAALAGMLAINR